MIVLNFIAMFHWKVFLGGAFLAAAALGSVRSLFDGAWLIHMPLLMELFVVTAAGFLAERLTSHRRADR